VRGSLDAEDTRALGVALAALGAGVTWADAGTVLVRGVAGRPRGGVTLACRDGGTPARFLMSVAALAAEPVTVDGSARLRERPMGDGVALLRALGVPCTHDGAPGCLPITVRGHGAVMGGALRVGATASSQFVSGLMLVAPWFETGLSLAFDAPPTSESYIRLTIEALRQWGRAVEVREDARGALDRVRVPPGPPAARDTEVEPDASSALYWAVAAALVEGSEVELPGLALASVQPDMGALRALAGMGARVTQAETGVRVACAARGGGAPLRGGVLDCAAFPDGALALVAAAAVAEAPTRFTGLGTLRVKESDRIEAMAANLRALGARCESGADWIEVHPVREPRRAVLATFRDHRVAMAFAVLGLRLGGVSIEDPGCVSKSYPGFWRDLEALAGPRTP
jgi:3-phosphoshikimate 1-carboxyvinyltransferase